MKSNRRAHASAFRSCFATSWVWSRGSGLPLFVFLMKWSRVIARFSKTRIWRLLAIKQLSKCTIYWALIKSTRQIRCYRFQKPCAHHRSGSAAFHWWRSANSWAQVSLVLLDTFIATTANSLLLPLASWLLNLALNTLPEAPDPKSWVNFSKAGMVNTRFNRCLDTTYLTVSNLSTDIQYQSAIIRRNGGREVFVFKRLCCGRPIARINS